MVEIFQNRQALLDDGMRFLAFDVRNEADTAAVMFVCRVIQTLRHRVKSRAHA